jgi:predicted ATPase
MMDKPAKFLWGFQTMIVDQSSSSSGSQFQLLSGMDISRHKEFELIGSCYRSCLSGHSQVVIIQGESGSGKSWVAHQVGSFITVSGGIFLSGKFDQVNQATPFSALASVFGQYCDILLSSWESSWVKMIAYQLRVALGHDACHLISVIPKLGLILEDDNYGAASVLTDLNCSNAVQRLHRLFCLLLEIMTDNAVSITLCMDDMQWADEASISVLTRLVTQECKKFFLLGCCREKEMKNGHPFWNLLKSVQIAGVKITTIQLHEVGEDELNRVISDLLCLSPRLVRPLSDIVHSKTHGNILFISQLMLSLHRDGLLYLDYDQQRWMWDKDNIVSRKLPDNVALCFTNGIKKLPVDEQAALHTLSMFGLSLKFEYMQLLESQIGLRLLDPLERAASEGLVIKQKGSYEFSHDSIQEASYTMVGDPLRKNNHLIYGKCLVQQSCRGNDNEMLFVAVNQINLAGPSSVIGSDEYLAMASYNLIVGKKAMAMSAFYAACSFFNHGIAFLAGKHYWRDHYTLSLELFELASKSALAAGNTQSVQMHIDELIKNARCFDDTLNAHYIHVSFLAHMSRLEEAVEKGISIVSKLGEEIPSNPSNEVLNRHILQTQSMIKGVSEDDLMNKPMMTDSKKLMAIKFLAEIQGIAFVILPPVHKIVIMKMVQMTIAFGLSPAAPFGIACFGSFLAKNGNLKAGHRFVLLAKSLLNKIDAKELAGKVLCVVAETCCYMEPVLAANERRVEAEIAAISGGDTYWASTCRMQYVADLLWGGTHLSSLKSKMTEAQGFAKQCQNMTLLAFLFSVQRSIDVLLGIETELLGFDELSASVGHQTNARHKMILCFHNLYLSLVFNKSDLRQRCEAFLQSEIPSSCFLMSSDSVQAFCVGLASFQIYRETRSHEWLMNAKKRLQDMKLWNEQGISWNFKHKLQLMEAEEHYSIGNLKLAKESYRNAIESSRLSRLVNDEALANELAGRFYFETGDLASSLEHFRFAHNNYGDWGAIRKASHLFEYTNDTFTSYLSNRHSDQG